MDELKRAEVGVECRGQWIPALLYADDMVMFAEEEEGLVRGLKVLEEWCEKWSVKVNAEKCGIMHFRKRRVKRSKEEFSVNGERVDQVAEYKYLGCVISEHLGSKRMLEERAKTGARALSAWLKRCRTSVGEVKGETFVRLLEALVELVLLYGAEVWGGGKQLGLIEQVQMRAARIFLGVGRLHPRVALQFEMRMVPLEWEAKRRCVEYWVNVLRMSDCRLVKLVMVEALEMRGRIEWVRDLQRSLNAFGWGNVNVEDLGRLSAGEIGQMLHDSAVRSVKSSWEAEAQDRSKLDVLQRLLVNGCKARCVDVASKSVRRIVAKLRGRTAELRVETGRWCGLKRDERLCKQCTKQEVEDEEHFLLRCGDMMKEREVMEMYLSESVEGFEDMTDRLKVAVMLDYACRDERVGRMLEKMWRQRFM